MYRLTQVVDNSQSRKGNLQTFQWLTQNAIGPLSGLKTIRSDVEDFRGQLCEIFAGVFSAGAGHE